MSTIIMNDKDQALSLFKTGAGQHCLSLHTGIPVCRSKGGNFSTSQHD